MVHPRRVDRLHQRVEIGEGGEEDPHRVGRDLAGAGQQLGAAHPGHALVAHHHRDLLPAEEIEGGGGAVGPQHAVLHGEQRLEGVEHPRLVVDEEDGGGHWALGAAVRLIGRRIVKTAPPSGGLSARISPPCLATIS